MPLKLYSSGNLAEVLNVSARSLRWWLNKADPELGYVEPYATVDKNHATGEIMLKLWHEDQIEDVRSGYAFYLNHLIDEKIAAQTRRKEYLREYNKRYYEEKRKEVPLDEDDDNERAERALQFLLSKQDA